MADIAMTGHARRVLFRQGTVLKAVVLLLLTLLIVLPLLRTFMFTLEPGNLGAWRDVLTGRLSRNLFYVPLMNTMLIGVVTALGCVLLGGFLAWLVGLSRGWLRRVGRRGVARYGPATYL